MATYPIEVQPFDVPESVRLVMPPGRRQDGMRALPELRLSDLPRTTIEAMCAEFASRVITKFEQQCLACEREAEAQSFVTTRGG